MACREEQDLSLALEAIKQLAKSVDRERRVVDVLGVRVVCHEIPPHPVLFVSRKCPVTRDVHEDRVVLVDVERRELLERGEDRGLGRT